MDNLMSGDEVLTRAVWVYLYGQLGTCIHRCCSSRWCVCTVLAELTTQSECSMLQLGHSSRRPASAVPRGVRAHQPGALRRQLRRVLLLGDEADTSSERPVDLSASPQSRKLDLIIKWLLDPLHLEDA